MKPLSLSSPEAEGLLSILKGFSVSFSSFPTFSQVFSEICSPILIYCMANLYSTLLELVVHQGLLLSKDPGQFFERQSSKDPLFPPLLYLAYKKFAQLSLYRPKGLASAICYTTSEAARKFDKSLI